MHSQTAPPPPPCIGGSGEPPDSPARFLQPVLIFPFIQIPCTPSLVALDSSPAARDASGNPYRAGGAAGTIPEMIRWVAVCDLFTGGVCACAKKSRSQWILKLKPSISIPWFRTLPWGASLCIHARLLRKNQLPWEKCMALGLTNSKDLWC